MPSPRVMKFGLAGVLGLTTLVAIINMIISAALTSSYNGNGYPSTRTRNVVRFTLFVSIFNIIFGGAYIFFVFALATSIIASIASVLAFTFLLWIFWLASAATSDDIIDCANNAFYHCSALRAMEAFSWINFILFFVTFAAVAFFGFKATRKGDGLTGALAA